MTDTAPTNAFSVPEISCDHCRSTIVTAVAPLAGVTRVDVDTDAKTVTVDGGQFAAIVKAIEDVGFDVEV